jgi:SAM-dependent methyltransferase
MSSPSLRKKRDIWHEKPVLRTIYEDYFDLIASACLPGRTLEFGAGGTPAELRSEGHFIAADIQFGPWLDVVADAQQMPVSDGALDNITMLDVLHHLAYPVRFLEESARTLRPGGRLIMIEPAISLASHLPLLLFHHETVDMSVDPLRSEPVCGPEPDDANQAIPTLLLSRYRTSFEARFPDLAIRDMSWLSIWAYPLSGGLRPWRLISPGVAAKLIRLERRLPQWMARI